MCCCCCRTLPRRVPLQQLQARAALRATRPGAEAVRDEVAAALADEEMQLAAVSAQLAQHAGAAERQVMQLDALALALLDNMHDKEAALSVEERAALLDGRASPAVPPQPSVLSVSGCHAAYALHARTHVLGAAVLHAIRHFGDARAVERPDTDTHLTRCWRNAALLPAPLPAWPAGEQQRCVWLQPAGRLRITGGITRQHRATRRPRRRQLCICEQQRAAAHQRSGG